MRFIVFIALLAFQNIAFAKESLTIKECLTNKTFTPILQGLGFEEAELKCTSDVKDCKKLKVYYKMDLTENCIQLFASIDGYRLYSEALLLDDIYPSVRALVPENVYKVAISEISLKSANSNTGIVLKPSQVLEYFESIIAPIPTSEEVVALYNGEATYFVSGKSTLPLCEAGSIQEIIISDAKSLEFYLKNKIQVIATYPGGTRFIIESLDSAIELNEKYKKGEIKEELPKQIEKLLLDNNIQMDLERYTRVQNSFKSLELISYKSIADPAKYPFKPKQDIFCSSSTPSLNLLASWTQLLSGGQVYFIPKSDPTPLVQFRNNHYLMTLEKLEEFIQKTNQTTTPHNTQNKD